MFICRDAATQINDGDINQQTFDPSLKYKNETPVKKITIHFGNAFQILNILSQVTE